MINDKYKYEYGEIVFKIKPPQCLIVLTALLSPLIDNMGSKERRAINNQKNNCI